MDHLYIITYDIRDTRRWRRLFKLMRGHGQWLQLSVFQCRLDKMRLLSLEDHIRTIVHQQEDHVLIVDLGPAEQIRPKVRSIGMAFQPVERKSIIV